MRIADQPPNLRTYICIHLFEEERPITYAANFENSLVVACGAEDHVNGASDWKIVCLSHMTMRDPSLLDSLFLKDGDEAFRTAEGTRIISSAPPGDGGQGKP